jgi:hypothetical protein
MGAVLLTYFDKAKAKGGLAAQVKLAMLTKLSSQQASQTPDTPDNVKIFEAALAQL